ncbi:hypothetical protein EJ03DRAFT_327361 [Teratosphaeria nubilosa]|uniref:Uncharacterized protein n=1 Tax=Teratosphaeria nubilosa TaxID=161662 RepID=A0A6G1LBB5_9PEZI|nr:hypothetical protein EJ03DRAFT_327361 [Teratosphaeria nubilosa]
MSLIPPSKGLIAVEDYKQYILPPPDPSAKKESYGIAVFHQLRCLWLIMDTIKQLGSGENLDLHPDVKPGEELDHAFHCVDYLRKSVMCAGDTSLEGSDLYREEDPSTQESGTTHICKDYDAIFAWAEANRYME